MAYKQENETEDFTQSGLPEPETVTNVATLESEQSERAEPIIFSQGGLPQPSAVTNVPLESTPPEQENFSQTGIEPYIPTFKPGSELYESPIPSPFVQYQLPPPEIEELPTGLATEGGARVIGGSADAPIELEFNGLSVSRFGHVRGGQKRYNNGSGFFMGYENGKYKLSIGDGGANYLTWDGTTLSVTGAAVNQIDIGGLDNTSFHVDTSGNAWWGSSTISGSVASVSSGGAAVFTSIKVGGSTTQYSINDSGIFSFGDGSDGALTTSGNVTLTSDKYYTNLTVSTGDTFNPAGYRIFCNGVLTLAGTGKIARNGNAGTNGSDGSGTSGGAAGTNGAALADGYLKGSQATGTSGAGGNQGNVGNAGGNGSNTSNSIGSSSSASGAGGEGGGVSGLFGNTAGGAAGTAGTSTTANVKLIANWHLATLLDIASSGSTVKFDNSASSGGAGGAGGGVASTGTAGGGGGGGGSGSAGGIIAIYAREIIVGASASITANGGNGGNGGNGANASVANAGGGGGGGGGAGGNGGQVILVYNTLTNNGTISASAGTAGTGGTFGTGLGTGINGTAGNNGTAGTAGTVRQFQLSL